MAMRFTCLVGFLSFLVALDAANSAMASSHTAEAFANLIEQHCVHCHDADAREGMLAFGGLLKQDISKNTQVWEKILRKIDSRQMPPLGEDRPSEAEYDAITAYLVTALDSAASREPNPGRTDTFRRLNRTEYQHAIRDLLVLEIDAAALLPADEPSHGFDHVAVGGLAPALLTRYVQAALKISRLAVGRPLGQPDGTTYRIPGDVTQENHVSGLPLGTRGGGLFRHTFPCDGEYEVQVRLTRDRNDEVEGLNGSHQLEVLVDRERVAEFSIERPKRKAANHFDDTKLKACFHVQAGPHDLGVTFIDNGGTLEETKRQPLHVHFNLHRHPRLSPAIYQVSITGPFATGKSPQPRTETPSRRQIFEPKPTSDDDKEAAAKRILSALARRAYRRPVNGDDLDRLLKFFRETEQQEGFEEGIEMAVSAILTSPHFLFKIERDPTADSVGPGVPYRISDFELASRLSFFLWSSIPDDELLAIAERGELRQPHILEEQVRRMLADDKASSLAANFASQWLQLRNLDSKTPDGRLFPDFDHNLRIAMRRETELHFQKLVNSDGTVLDLIETDHTYVNERLAKHYGIPHIYGSRFRRVDLPEQSQRGGLLRHGSILTVTSYATRTSPVIRGNWVLENILGSPAPPPPKNVPSLDAGVLSAKLSVRDRLARHRADQACASCHNLMDPVGFSLENFDAVGRWRDRESGEPVDASGSLPDGAAFEGVAGLERAILRRPGVFVGTLTEKLMTFALGRGVEHYDGPAIRRIVQEAAKDNYQFSALVLGIVRSEPFQMRNSK